MLLPLECWVLFFSNHPVGGTLKTKLSSLRRWEWPNAAGGDEKGNDEKKKKIVEKKEWKKRRGRGRSQSTPVCDEVVTAKTMLFRMDID